MENMCNNIIHISYYDNNIQDKINKSNEIYDYISEHFSLSSGLLDEDGAMIRCEFTTEATAPLFKLSELSKEKGVDIIGVAYEFDGGYVDSFEYLIDLNEEESGGFIKVEESQYGEVSVSDDEFDSLEKTDLDITDTELLKFENEK